MRRVDPAALDQVLLPRGRRKEKKKKKEKRKKRREGKERKGKKRRKRRRGCKGPRKFPKEIFRKANGVKTKKDSRALLC